jgi:2-keto-myo-inositol isomerase
MNLSNFGPDSITLPGSLEAKLAATRAAGFSQIMLWAKDISGHPQGTQAAIDAVRASGLRVTGIQVMRDFEGLSGTLHAYKIDVAKAMLQICKQVGAPVLMVCSSVSAHATGSLAAIAKDMAKLATLATPLGVKVGFEALSWGRHVNEYPQSWRVVELADHPNLGIVLDSYHIFAGASAQARVNGARLGNASEVLGKDGARVVDEDVIEAILAPLDDIDPAKIWLVQLADFMWDGILAVQDRIETARHSRVFPGEGIHSTEMARFVRKLDQLGYERDYSFEIFNDDFLQMPLETVLGRAKRSAKWVTDQVLRRSLPVRQPIVG